MKISQLKLFSLLFALLFVLMSVISVHAAGDFLTTLKDRGKMPDGRPVKVALAAAELEAEYTQKIFNYLKRLLEASGAEVVAYTNANWDASKQEFQLDDFIQQKVDAIVVQIVDSNALEPVSKRVQEAGIALITVNRHVEGDAWNLHIGIDNAQFGALAGKLFVEKFQGQDVSVVETQGELHLELAQGRHRGFVGEIEKSPNIKVVSRPCEWKAQMAMAAISDNLVSQKNLKGAFSHSDLMVPGIISALKQAKMLYPVGHPEHFFIGSVDAAPYGVKQVKEGYLDFTIEQNSYIFATLSAKGILDYVVKGKKLKKWIDVAPVLVTKDNADDLWHYANFDLKKQEGAWPGTEEAWKIPLE